MPHPARYHAGAALLERDLALLAPFVEYLVSLPESSTRSSSPWGCISQCGQSALHGNAATSRPSMSPSWVLMLRQKSGVTSMVDAVPEGERQT
jgi:hypothetical protein